VVNRLATELATPVIPLIRHFKYNDPIITQFRSDRNEHSRMVFASV